MKRLAMVLVLGILAVLTTGSALASHELSRVRVLHASPDAPPVNVLIDGRVAFHRLPFRTLTRYLSLEAGSYNVKVVTADRDQAVVIDADVELMGSTDYTVAAVGRAANIEPLLLEDNSSRPDRFGQATIRFVHVSPDAPAVDVAVAGGDTLFPGVAFKGVTDYSTVNRGVYNLEVRQAGTDSVVLRLPHVPVPPGASLTVFALGLVGDDVQPYQMLRVRVVDDSRFPHQPYPYYWRNRLPYHGGGFYQPPAYYHQPHNYNRCYGCTPYYRPRYEYNQYRYW